MHNSKKRILIVSIGYKPNMGGLETHLNDLVTALHHNHLQATVLTYKPITTQVNAPLHETSEEAEVFRIPWLGNIFYRLVNTPVLEFIYLFPGLFLALPIFLLFRGSEVKVIHSHGLIAGFPSVFWGKIFHKKVITTTHSIYNFPKSGLYRNFSAWIFNNSDDVLVLSKQSKKEVENLGVNKNKVKLFTYWVDLEAFQKISHAKKKLGWGDQFSVLVAGRLVAEKGIIPALKAASTWDKNIKLVVAGTGPLVDLVKDYAKRFSNIFYLGRIAPRDMPRYYSAADLLLIPSVHEEGFGRIILEALACGTPVVGSNRGAIPEAMDETVGRIIEITPENIKDTIEDLYFKKSKLSNLTKNCRNYALSRYSEKNSQTIINCYL